MLQTIAITEGIKSLNDLQSKFNLIQTENEDFFPEWYEDLPELTPEEKSALDRLKKRYKYHRASGPLLEGTINLLVVFPLLEIAGFLDAPFKIRSPELVELSIEDPDRTIFKGMIDVLVIQDNFWVLVVESKRTSIPVESALPQILAYMMANHQHFDYAQCTHNYHTFGMATNGDSIIFIKLTKAEIPQYDLSDAFLLLPRRNKLYEVLKILKKCGGLGQLR